MTTVPDTDEPVVLAVTGMTCAACAARIEKKLNRLDGVTATVNYATAKATVHHEGASDETFVHALIDTVEGMGYGAIAPQRDNSAASTAEIATEAHLIDIRRRFIVSAICATPVMAMSMIGPLQFDGWQWVCLVLALPVAIWGALPFHRAAWRNARHGATTMDTLVSLGVIAAMAWSVWALIFGGAGEIGMKMNMSLFPRSDNAQVHESMDHGSMDTDVDSGAGGAHHEIYLEVATTLTAFLLAGRYFEVRSRRRAGAALRALLNLGAKEATLWRDGVETTVPIAALAVGDVFVVRPGETIATDGVVIDGSSAVDRSMVTGESVPVDAVVGDTVTGGTLNTTGRLLVRATRIGRDTVLAQMARLVEKAQDGKAPVQRLADRVSAVFVPFVMTLAVVTLVVWLIVTGDTERSFQVAVSVLIIACPCALGLATPVALLVGTGRAARDGIIIKGAQVLEATQAVDVIVLDKTGTITTGHMTLEDVEFLGTSIDQPSTLAAAMAVERRSEHPLARAIVRGLQDRGVDDSACVVSEFESLPGVGVSALVDGV
ncbi:MAG: heavy metal translocating P-type ATPase, partial [Ilumatobacteraceae bacterium]